MDHAIPEIVELAVDKVCDYVQVDNIPFAPGHVKDKIKRFFQGWHVTVATSALIAFGVLITNLCLLIWAEVRHVGTVTDGVLTLFQGSCSSMKNIFTWSHVGINILSTMLLAASNTSCQVLCAPTRKEVDVAHAAGHWLDVGVSSLRNLRFVAVKRLVVFLLLSLSSIPIHLIYNSVIFPTTTANNNMALLVTNAFVRGEFWSKDAVLGRGSATNKKSVEVLKTLQEKAVNGKLVNLTKSECISQFSSAYISEYRNFLVLVDDPPGTNKIVLQGSIKRALDGANMNWLCNGPNVSPWSFPKNGELRYKCISSQVSSHATSWKMEQKDRPFDQHTPLVSVKHCMAEQVEQKCTIGMSRSLLVAVIICNFVKLVCFVLVVRWGNNMPLVTVGDAIDSFLRRPDASTEDLGPVSALDVRKGVWNHDPKCITQHQMDWTWKAKKYFWYSAAGWRRWAIVAFFLLLLFIPAAATLPALAFTGAGTWGDITKMGSISENFVIQTTSNWSIPAEVVFVNLPQLIISFAYILFNNVLTSSLQASETSDYGKHRKGLRVTSSEHLQRSTYWLQVPYRYAVPIMSFWVVVHWLTSQSIFLARVDVRDYVPHSVREFAKVINGCGFSPIPVLMVICFMAALLLGMFALGLRRYPRNVPLMSSCSVAIAAACHASHEEGEEMASMPVQYGVLKTVKLIDGVKYKTVGFSSEEVEELVKGETYR